MPRLNAVLMGLLGAAVIGTAVFLSLEQASPALGPDPAVVANLLRKLSDSDPDVRREAERGFRAMGPKAVAPLAEASKSEDRRLAEHAARLLREFEPAKPAPELAKTVEPAPEPPGKVDPVELVLVCGRTALKPGQPLRFYVRLVNHATAPILVARSAFSLAPFAWIEVVDEKGVVTRFAPEPGAVPLDRLQVEVADVAPGQTWDFYASFGDGGTGLASLPGKGVFQVRFVYDASPESAYRKQVSASEQGTLLPPQRLVSNALEIAVAE
jgi:hypothetical protein